MTRTRAENRQKGPGVSAGVSVNLTFQKNEKSAKSRHYSSIVSGTRIHKIATKQRSNRSSAPDCDTRLSHNRGVEEHLNLSNTSQNRRSNCDTQVSHRRRCGLWRRGAVYQYRVRVPHDLIDRVGRTHINQSLKTASFSVASRLVRKVSGVAFKISAGDSFGCGRRCFLFRPRPTHNPSHKLSRARTAMTP